MDVQKRPAAPEPCDALAAALGRAALALGRAGRPTEASRLAAAGYVAVRREHPGAARRLNGVMHALARMSEQPLTTTKEHPMPDTTLDVRTEPPARRHELIFDRFAGLGAGDGFELVNDHDPKPLYYQLEAEHTGQFTWEYREQGPEVWRVRIGRAA
ncbi:MAG TPA: DUF2249 domain-containing protein [Baekduia sp.]|nr:DUF2249 domain-containing protein [Baekduia sp.]